MRTTLRLTVLALSAAALTGCDNTPEPEAPPASPATPATTETATAGDVPVLENRDGTLAPTTPPGS